ncbi:MFS transporter [Streptodolium elevatio]|uniref:MFS transporter n=1 Tax=Streptodolium elevatio TaxID=3157996 RepID=A0ABV3DK43_9ACTN
MQSGSPWRIPGFRPLFAANATSHLATDIAYVAIPLVAVTSLDAGTAQVGLLGALGAVAFVAFGLPAGVWIDRLPHHRVLVAADVARTLLLLSVPVAWWADVLTFTQLCVVVLLNGTATVFFNVGAQSMLPGIACHGNLLRANTLIYGLMATGLIAGRAAGGGLVQLLGPAAAVGGAGVAYLVSAHQLALLPRVRAATVPATAPQCEPQTEAHTPATHLRRDELVAGFRHVFGHRELRPLATTVALTNLGAQMINTLLPVLFTRGLGLPAAALGLMWALSGVGNLLGAYLARPVAAAFGFGPTLGLTGLWLAPWALLIPLIDSGPWLCVAALGWLLATTKMGFDNVLGISLRQVRTPTALQGRMNATVHIVFTGAMAIGSAAAGLIARFADLRTALWTAGIVLATAFVPVALSPIRKLPAFPAPLPQ